MAADGFLKSSDLHHHWEHLCSNSYLRCMLEVRLQKGTRLAALSSIRVPGSAVFQTMIQLTSQIAGRTQVPIRCSALKDLSCVAVTAPKDICLPLHSWALRHLWKELLFTLDGISAARELGHSLSTD